MISRRQLLFSTLATRLGLRAASPLGGAWLQDIQPGRATLVWCGSPQDGLLTWESPGRSRIQVSASPTPLADGRTLWKARLEGLSAHAEIRYSAGASAGSFRAPAPPQALPSGLRFLALGDSGSGSEYQFQLAQRLESEAADLVLHTGDIAYPYSSDQALESAYFQTYRSLMGRAAFYPCPGNHDYVEDLAPYLRWHSLPATPGVAPADQGRYYAFEAQGVEFIALDSNDPLWEAQRMLSWLDARLAASRNYWRIVFFHHPPYTAGHHAADESCRLAAERLAPRLEAARIPLVLNGHEHSYQRLLSQQTTYLVTGGGGAGLYDPGRHDKLQCGGAWHHYLRASVEPWRLEVEAVGLAGESLDRVSLSPPPFLRSVVNAAGFQPRLAPGAVASLFGYHLCSSAPGLEVDLDGTPLEVLGSSGTQVNVLLPMRQSGLAQLRVRTPNGATTFELELRPSAPALFRDAQGRPLLHVAEARAGDAVRLYLTGSGGRRVRLRTGSRDLGFFQPLASTTLRGVEEIQLTLPAAWESLSVEAES